MSHVFISYKREERDKARRLADALEAASLQVWWDPKLEAGERYDSVIEQAIRDAAAVVVLWSTAAVNSEYIRDEASLALKLGKIVPVLTDGVELPLRFQGLHSVKLTDWSGPEPGPEFASLLRGIAALSAGASQASAPSPTMPVQSRHRASLWTRKRLALLSGAGLFAALIVFATYALNYPPQKLATPSATSIKDVVRWNVEENTDYDLRDGDMPLKLSVKSVNVDQRFVELALSAGGMSTDLIRVGPGLERVVKVGSREYALSVQDFADVISGRDLARITVVAK